MLMNHNNLWLQLSGFVPGLVIVRRGDSLYLAGQLASFEHNLAPTAQALNLDVRPNPQHFPLAAAARVCFAQMHMVVNL
jgi:hypothetical protein